MDTDRRLPSQAERVTSVGVLGTGLLLFTVLAACAPPYRPRVAQYQNIVLDARELGAKQLDIEMQRDPAIRDYVARNGNPDFIYVPSATVVELIYFRSSKLILFYRDQSGAGSVIGELSPLPLEVANVLPVDIRAGTSGPISEDTTVSCWTVSAATHRCHTCCEGPLFCSTSCKEEPSQSARHTDGFAVVSLGFLGDGRTHGNYTAVDAGLTAAGGAGVAAMKNQNGATVELVSTTRGVEIGLGGAGVDMKVKK